MAGAPSVRIISRIREVKQADWDQLVGSGSPFLRWDWLDSLEATGCVGERTGWLPQHLIVEREGELVGGCPVYLKSHSMGEFVFDYEWAEYARRTGIRYYPKILAGVPFTPVTGSRFLTDSREERRPMVRLMGQALAGLAADHRLSSVHVNFCLEEEKGILEEIGFLPRVGLQFHWTNRGYGSFDHYLESFRSERRNKIRRERRELEKQGIAIRALEEGELAPDHLRVMFGLYQGHVERFAYGRQYLTLEFFEELSRRFRRYLCLIFAERDARIIAGTFNVRDGEALYGRYWGAFEEERYLHFNVCYYAAIEHSIAQGLRRFEAGSGGSFKRLRGLDPQPTYSVHYFTEERFQRAVESHLRLEREAVREKRDLLLERSPLKREDG
jgi:predicted N-acyltransferase